MGKGFFREIVFSLCFLLCSCIPTKPMHSEQNGSFFEGEVGKEVEVIIFDGFKLSPIDKEIELIKKRVPVTKGNYFILYFIEEGFVPELKVLRAANKDTTIGKIRLKKMKNKNKGYLVGVVYKPVRGGKIFFTKGILKLISGVEIKVVNNKSRSYSTIPEHNGVFSIQLLAGRYKIFVGDYNKGFDVIINKGKTTIHNLQKGIVLID
ncbi:MAG: hypothetical protein ABIJ30_13320 [bacterium]